MPFPATIRALPKTVLGGADVYVHEGSGTQVLFIELPEDRPAVSVPTHTHGDEWGIVVEGEIQITLGDRTEPHGPGAIHFLPSGVPHSFRFAPGTRSVHYFAERRVTIPPPPL